MTIQSLSWALDQRLPGEAKLVLLALANRADHTTGQVYLDAASVAAEASISESSLPRYLGALRRNGYLARDGRPEDRHYWLLFDRDIAREWAWDAAEIAAENDSAPSARPAPDNAPPRFQKAAQATARAKLAKPEERKPVFVQFGTRAWDAWVQHKLRTEGRKWSLTTKGIAAGKEVTGWYFPTLFPPADEQGEQISA